jgi:hypothetical protein
MDAPMAQNPVNAIKHQGDDEHCGLRESLEALPFFEI